MAATALDAVASFLLAFEGKMTDMANAVKARGANVGADIVAAEDVAEAAAAALASTGNSIGVTAQQMLPFGEGVVNAAAQAAGVPIVPSSASAAKPAT